MIKILLFAHLQEAVGKGEIQLEIGQTTVEQLKAELQQKYRIAGLEHVMIAINEEYALDNSIINPGDTVAFIPPVSGG
ncbi:molybdopterin converting factor subunit 1 [Oceanobacillus arenosus]|uniref:Molybdopterin synthase sulfur carrier subunit n=1 Tax=Oceanobacillus arenosus TaxID=1229153 RepID=A0A3D8PXA2_9BACI|nr:molybdopterin converting factor subunit 1 [Oceanobacillus arenosus]RDW20167.1 molybdopterin converting factor subunit 1 [Oceanobacillus arenosus]